MTKVVEEDETMTLEELVAGNVGESALARSSPSDDGHFGSFDALRRNGLGERLITIDLKGLFSNPRTTQGRLEDPVETNDPT